MKRTQITLVTLAIAALFAGCSTLPGDDTMKPDEPPQAVQVHRSVSDGDTLLVQLGREHASATIEIHRNGPRPDGFIRDESIDSPFEYDMLLTDRHDNVMVSFAGSDHLANTDWRERINRPLASYDPDERRDDLRVIVDWVVPPAESNDAYTAFRWELQDARHAAQAALNEFDITDNVSSASPDANPATRPEARDFVPVPPAPPAPGPRSSIDSTTRFNSTAAPLSSTYIHRVAIRQAACCWSFGQHSAVIQSTLDASGTMVLFTNITGNHGRPASDPSMTNTAACPRQWSGRTNRIPTMQPFYASDIFMDANAGGCSTPYGLVAGTHVCNDDSLAEYWNVKYNAVASWSTCGDAPHPRASGPACD